ncbi:hypothetical protein CRM22_003564 [Opisthorchis felineus]|uniref:Glycosyl transferase 64 domain-containing protein n=1 Tax=Opisthorchis felineus TaxID=147828 RepID=A0A4S2M6P2_OPIFE|nr:hypothetical protein CRM22_003564 [Opisthorchis felineus]
MFPNSSRQNRSLLWKFRRNISNVRFQKAARVGIPLVLLALFIWASPLGIYKRSRVGTFEEPTWALERLANFTQEEGSIYGWPYQDRRLITETDNESQCRNETTLISAFKTSTIRYRMEARLINNAIKRCHYQKPGNNIMLEFTENVIRKWQSSMEGQLDTLPTKLTVSSGSGNMKTTNNDVLRFCLNQRTYVSNSISKQLYDALFNSPLRQLSCSDLSKAHIKILINWDDDKSCFQVYEHGFNTHNRPPCVLVLPTVSAEIEFQHKRDQTTIRNSPWIIMAPSFTFGSFHTGTDLVVTTMAYLELFNRSLDETSRILLNSRSRLLTLSIGRARNEEANRTSYTNLLLHDIEKLNVDVGHQKMSVVHISIHRMEKELLECLNMDTLQSMLQTFGESLVWFPCASSPELLRESVFGLVPITPPSTLNGSQVNTLSWQIQLLLCLASGAIPVLVGEGQLPFPMAIGYERWSRATIRISVHQLDQLLPFLLSMPAEEIEVLQQNGNKLFKWFLQDISAQTSTLLLELILRFGLMKPFAPHWRTVVTARPTPTISYHTQQLSGPVGLPSVPEHIYSLDQYTHTRSAPIGFEGQMIVNPFWSFPSTPWDIIQPQQQFTALILYYNRFKVLVKTLFAMQGLPFLQSIIIVWNNPIGPDEFVHWPHLQIPIKVFQATKNSLNNRFLPLDLILTDAVLLLDDDVKLSKEEIELGFNAWRENPDRIVGHPERGHRFDPKEKKWVYNAAPAEKYSMILTGAAFLHKVTKEFVN